jgi:prepilin-type N-terminal cleavage/methylation domain-containing protein
MHSDLQRLLWLEGNTYQIRLRLSKGSKVEGKAFGACAKLAGQGLVKGQTKEFTRGHKAGLTLVELLIAMVILAVALLAFAAGLADNLMGIRREGRVTVINQVAISVHESLRKAISEDPAAFDAGLSNQAFSPVTVANVAHTGSYTIIPYQLNSSGSLIGPSGTPHLFEVTVTVNVPDSNPRMYRTLVTRRPGT